MPLTGFSFGQRDALVVTFLLPYAAAAVARARGVTLRPGQAIAAGSLAALGIALKPFAGAVWIAVEAYLAFRRGPGLLKRVENVAIIGWGVAYLALVALFEADFFGFAAASAGAYRAYYPASVAILARQPVALFAAGTVALSLVLPARSPLRELRCILALATLGFLAGVFIQNKGWAYHWVPVQVSGGLLLATLVVDLLRASRVLRSGVPIAAVLMVLGTGLFAVDRLETARAEMPAFNQPVMIDILERFGEGGSVMALSVRIPPAFSFILSEASSVRWGSRFNVLWPVPAVYASAVIRPETPFPYHEGERSELEELLISGVTQDFLTSRPTLLIVDGRAPPGLAGFDSLAYLRSTSPGSREAFRRYEPLARVGDYVVYRRTDPVAGA